MIEIPVRQRLSEFAYKNQVMIEHNSIGFYLINILVKELSLLEEYLSLGHFGVYSTKVFLGGLPHDAKASIFLK